jgi:hypothetical protein
MMGVGLPAEWDVVVPHVEVRPVDADKEHKAAQTSVATGPWKNEPNADGDFHDAGDEHPNRWVAQHGRHDGFEPNGVGEMLDADVDVHTSKHDGGDGEDQASHGSPSRPEQVKVCVSSTHERTKLPMNSYKEFEHSMDNK